MTRAAIVLLIVAVFVALVGARAWQVRQRADAAYDAAQCQQFRIDGRCSWDGNGDGLTARACGCP